VLQKEMYVLLNLYVNIQSSIELCLNNRIDPLFHDKDKIKNRKRKRENGMIICHD
jgi:hypothetical protein